MCPGGLTVPERGSLPVVVVMCEAGEARQAARLPFPLPFLFLPRLLPPTVFLEELQLAVHLLGCSLPGPRQGTVLMTSRDIMKRRIVVLRLAQTRTWKTHSHTSSGDLCFSSTASNIASVLEANSLSGGSPRTLVSLTVTGS